MTNWKDKFEFKHVVSSWAEKLEIKVSSIYMRPMKNKWASCSSNGYLNFNSELLELDKSLGEYVIVHELLHLRASNHGALWKSYMNAYLPEWKILDKRLKEISKNVFQSGKI